MAKEIVWSKIAVFLDELTGYNQAIILPPDLDLIEILDCYASRQFRKAV